MMKRILYCTDTLAAGGIERQLVTLIRGLDKTKFEPHLLCLYGEKVGRSTHFASLLEEVSVPVTVLDIGWGSADKLYASWKIIEAVWRIRPQIVQAMNYHSNLLSRLVRPLIPPSVRLIGTVRNQETEKQLLYHRLSWRSCHLMIVNSPHLKQDLIERAKMPSDKVRFIPNGLDVDCFSQNPQPQLRVQIAPNARRLMVMVGRIGRQKSPHLLAQALGILKESGQLPPDVAVVIVGESDPHPLHATQHLLDEAVSRYQLQSILTQYPRTNEPQAYYHAADVTILPSLYEGLPNVMLESLAVGRPVIISEAANRAGVIEHGKTGWIVRTEDVQHLADTLLYVLSLSDAQLQPMQENCREVAQQFSIHKMVKAYEEVYDAC
jgi:glycosyltransferase involved in cell wall biosynthesis